MQIIYTLHQTDNDASTSPLSFYRPDAIPATKPTASKHRRTVVKTYENKMSYIFIIFFRGRICILLSEKCNRKLSCKPAYSTHIIGVLDVADMTELLTIGAHRCYSDCLVKTNDHAMDSSSVKICMFDVRWICCIS